jgi:hypothetical protein
MAKYATGKYAKAISDRSGLEFPYKEMVREWNGSFVHISEFEPKQPQLEPKPMNGDSISLRNVRPSRTAPEVTRLMKNNPFTTYASSSGVINVSFPGHGLTDGDTYRFRGPPLAVTASGGTFQFTNPGDFDGITGANIAKAAGYTITTGVFKGGARVTTDYAKANNFYFTVDTDTASIGGLSGGGVGCSVGPVTLSA